MSEEARFTEQQFDSVADVVSKWARKVAELEAKIAVQKLYIESCQGALTRMELALRGLLADREYQRLSGPPHFTSALTEYQDKQASANMAWDNAAQAVARLT